MSTPAAAPLAFDARPLAEPVDKRAVSAFQAELKARRVGGTPVSTIIGIVLMSLFGIVAIPVLVAIFASLAGSGGSSAIMFVFPGIFVVAAGGILALNIANRGRARTTSYRLNRFAQANGMSYVDRITDPRLPGMIFGLGSGRIATDLVRGTTPRFVEFGNYQYTVKSGKNSTTYTWGYVAVKLDVPLPNIVLDAKGNNSFGSNLPASFHREQRLSLEGDFDQHFTLYCPEGYERDALYLFTPDIMARFIDHAAELDVEIIDDWMFLYTRRKVSTLDPATWAWLFGVVGALITKFDQWARWRDERLLLENPAAAASASASAVPASLPFAAPVGMVTPPPGVAMPGRRLKRRFAWLPIVFIVLFGAFTIWSRLN